MFEDLVLLVAANLSVAVLVRILKPNLSTAALLAVVLIASIWYLGTHHGTQRVMAGHQGRNAGR